MSNASIHASTTRTTASSVTSSSSMTGNSAACCRLSPLRCPIPPPNEMPVSTTLDGHLRRTTDPDYLHSLRRAPHHPRRGCGGDGGVPCGYPTLRIPRHLGAGRPRDDSAAQTPSFRTATTEVLP